MTTPGDSTKRRPLAKRAAEVRRKDRIQLDEPQLVLWTHALDHTTGHRSGAWTGFENTLGRTRADVPAQRCAERAAARKHRPGGVLIAEELAEECPMVVEGHDEAYILDFEIGDCEID